MPTGKMTDSGHPVRRLHRVLDAPLVQQPAPAAQPKPARIAQQPPEPPPWEEFEDDWEQLPPAAQEPEQAAALAKAAEKPAKYDQYEQKAKAAEEERAAKAAFDARQAAKPLPIDHEILASIAQREKIKSNTGFSGVATPEQWGLLKGLLEKAMGDKADRNVVLARLAGVKTEIVENPDWRAPKARAAAIIDWLVAKQPDGTATRPYTVADGRGADLATVLQGAWGTLAGAPTEDVPY
jgi:hypothetical protein